jgi:hypothetical protein
MPHITALYVMPAGYPLTTCGDRLQRASRAVLDSPVKPGNDGNGVLLMNSLVSILLNDVAVIIFK